MIENYSVVVIMPAYNAARTLEKTWREIPHDIVDAVILTDDNSRDNTREIARNLHIPYILSHEKNKGYGGNQKTCYLKALELKADIIVMLHPDYQYTPLLIKPMAYLLASGLYDVVIGSRILGNGALKGGMPLYKYFANRCLTFVQNIALGQKLSEYHTGYRAYKREVLTAIDFEKNSDDFIFDNELLAQIVFADKNIAEISCPTKYFEEASSINLKRSIVYGFGVLRVCWLFILQKYFHWHTSLFDRVKRK
ncbi:MAG: glycosyltransferase family 2 protein [Chitinophagales bacterium]|nr:glycosyltransferase family 2 protein [Bacteroidota bacterium]MCB9043551.1 glycosyltransferase family 2 protein [Chitinophagales bacterium]